MTKIDSWQIKSQNNVGRTYFIFFTSLLAVLFYLFITYDFIWIHPEIIFYLDPIAFRSGTALSWKDISLALDVGSFDLVGRIRLLDHFFIILNAKFRYFIWLYYPQLKVISLTWGLCIISLYFFYQFLNNYTRDARLSFQVTLLFLFSPGFLSNITMLFRPAKPLALCCFALSLWLFEKFKKQLKPSTFEPRTPFFYPYLCALTLLIFLGYYADETTFFIPVALMVFNFPVFYRWFKTVKIYPILIFSTIPFFLLFSHFILTLWINQLNFGYTFSMFDIMHYNQKAENWNPILLISKFCINFILSISSHFYNFNFSINPHEFSGIYFSNAVILLILITALILPRPQQRLLRNGWIGLILYAGFHTILHTKHMDIAAVFYYGISFSFFYAVLVRCLCYSLPLPFNHLLYGIVLVVFCFNSLETNFIWKTGQQIVFDKWQLDPPPNYHDSHKYLPCTMCRP